MRISALLFFLCSALNAVTGQEAVFFNSADSLTVRGDLYLKNIRFPFIIICEDGAERSDYAEIAPRLLNLNYNCLTIYLRPGASLRASTDISGAIRYARSLNHQPVILMGSSKPGSLCLLLAVGNPDIKAVIALSPGEYFQPVKNMCDEVGKIKQPVFVTATQLEYPYLQRMFSGMLSGNVSLYKPEKGAGMHGAGALRSSGSNSGEYWFALMMFFKKIV